MGQHRHPSRQGLTPHPRPTPAPPVPVLESLRTEGPMPSSVMPMIKPQGGPVPPAAVSAVGLRKSYGDKTVLDGIDLRIPAGSVFALLGPN
ncbi:hypothetical protein ACFW1H_36355, partial [Streptomyces sp. NPDC058954]